MLLDPTLEYSTHQPGFSILASEPVLEAGPQSRAVHPGGPRQKKSAPGVFLAGRALCLRLMTLISGERDFHSWVCLFAPGFIGTSRNLTSGSDVSFQLNRALR